MKIDHGMPWKCPTLYMDKVWNRWFPTQLCKKKRGSALIFCTARDSLHLGHGAGQTPETRLDMARQAEAIGLRLDNFWLVVWNIFYFPYLGNVFSHPNWLLLFRGGETTNQTWVSAWLSTCFLVNPRSNRFFRELGARFLATLLRGLQPRNHGQFPWSLIYIDVFYKFTLR